MDIWDVASRGVSESQKWHDVGHLENYFSTKQFVLKTRYFNSLQFDDLGENVVKTSQDNTKLINEINWYKNIPNDILELVPKIKDSDVSSNPFLKLEYVKHPTLSELWLYSDFPSEFWKNIIQGLLDITQIFKKHKLSKKHSEICADYLIKAELVEAKSHGLTRLNMYCKRIRRKLINAKPKIKIKKINS